MVSGPRHHIYFPYRNIPAELFFTFCLSAIVTEEPAGKVCAKIILPIDVTRPPDYDQNHRCRKPQFLENTSRANIFVAILCITKPIRAMIPDPGNYGTRRQFFQWEEVCGNPADLPETDSRIPTQRFLKAFKRGLPAGGLFIVEQS